MKCFVSLCVVLIVFTSKVFAKNRSSWHKNNLLKSQSISTKSSEVKIHVEGDLVISFPVAKTEYIFLKYDGEKVIIIDANSYEEVTSYTLPGISGSMVAIVNDEFYHINTVNGTIWSTAVENILNGPNAVNWANVGSFPSENTWISNGVVVDDSSIYFVTYSGVLYLYDTTLKTVSQMGSVAVAEENHASLVVVDGILYIYFWRNFYSFDGADDDAIKEIATSESRYRPGLFQLGSLVCLVGGNDSNVSLNPDPVLCYNPSEETWTVSSYINQSRRSFGITSTESGTYIFGGFNNRTGDWLNSVEAFNPKTKTWGYIPSPLPNQPIGVQALTFYF